MAALTLVLGFGLSVSYVVTSQVTEGAVFDARVERTRQLAHLVGGRLATMLPARGLQAREALTAMRRLVHQDRLFIVDARCRCVHDASGAAQELDRWVSESALARLMERPTDYVVVPAHSGGSRHLVVLAPVPIGNVAPMSGRLGTDRLFVVLISDLSATDARGVVLRRMLMLFTLIILALALVLGYVLLGRLVVRPVQRLMRPVERVRAGEFVRADTQHASSSEMIQLYEAFNRMSAWLADDRQRIEAQVAELTLKNREIEAAHVQLVSHEKLATVGTLAAGVAHEIGNPIAVLQGYVELLADADDEEDPAQRAKYVAAMDDAVRRISTIIADLLDFARPIDESDRLCDVAAVVQQTVQLVEPQARFRDVQLVVTIDGDGGAIPAQINAGRLEQVLLNLLFNAADVSPSQVRGVVEIHVERRVGDDGDEVVVRVADQGPGISSQVLRQMFDPFFTTKDPGQGTGLGLSICHNIVSSYGGRIYAEVPAEGGTRFTVVLRA